MIESDASEDCTRVGDDAAENCQQHHHQQQQLCYHFTPSLSRRLPTPTHALGKTQQSKRSSVQFMVCKQVKQTVVHFPTPPANVTTLTCELQNFFIWLKVCCVLSNAEGSEESQLWVVVGGSEKSGLWCVVAGPLGKQCHSKCSEWPPTALIHASSWEKRGEKKRGEVVIFCSCLCPCKILAHYLYNKPRWQCTREKRNSICIMQPPNIQLARMQCTTTSTHE